MTLLIRIYFVFTFVLDIFSYCIVLFRLWRGKEDPHRYSERIGKYQKIRPQSVLIWFHGASVGEIQSIIPLIEKFEKNKKVSLILITSNTKSSSYIIKDMFIIFFY